MQNPAGALQPARLARSGQGEEEGLRRGGGDGCVTRPYFVEIAKQHRDPPALHSLLSPHPRCAVPSDERTAAGENSNGALSVPAAITSWLFYSTMRAGTSDEA